MSEESRRAHLLHQSPADGILVRVVRVGKARRGPVLCPARELRVPRLEERPVQMRESVHETSIALEDRLLFGDEGLIGAPEILRLHADRLRLRLHFDRLVETCRPFLMQYFLGHAVGERRARGELLRGIERGLQHLVGLGETIEETPGEALFARHRPAGIQELGSASLADHPRQHRAGAHVAPCEPDAREEERHLRAARAVAQVGRESDDRARAGARAVHGRDDRLRAVAHRLDQVSRHARKLQQLGLAHPRERPDDLVYIAAGAEIAARARDDHRLDVARGAQAAEKIAQLAVGLEGEGILLLRPIEREHADPALGAPLETLRPVSRESGCLHAPSFRSVVSSAWLFTLASRRNSSACSLRLKPESTEMIHSSCARAILPKTSYPARVSRTRNARRSPGSGKRSASFSFTNWSTIPVTLPPVTIRWCESSFILRPPG